MKKIKQFWNRNFGNWYFIPTSCNTCGSVIGRNENGFQLHPIYETTYYFLWLRLTVKRNKLTFFDSTTGRGKPYGSKKVYSINTSCIESNKHYLNVYKQHINNYATTY